MARPIGPFRIRHSRQSARWREDGHSAAGYRHLSRLHCGYSGSGEPPVSVSLYELHELRPTLLDHSVSTVRPGEYDNGGLRDVRSVPERVRRSDGPSLSRATQRVSRVRTAY